MRRSSTRCARRSRRRAAPSRSSSATRSWPRSACRASTRTTLRAHSAPRSACGRGCALNVSLRERHAVTLELRIGVNTGEVLAALDPRPGEALATGDAVNAAARLEQGAQPGQVLVAERTAQAARGFRFGEPQVLELRGKSEPLRAPSSCTPSSPSPREHSPPVCRSSVGAASSTSCSRRIAASSRSAARTSSRSTAMPGSGRAASSVSCSRRSRRRRPRPSSSADVVSPTAAASRSGLWRSSRRRGRTSSTPMRARPPGCEIVGGGPRCARGGRRCRRRGARADARRRASASRGPDRPQRSPHELRGRADGRVAVVLLRARGRAPSIVPRRRPALGRRRAARATRGRLPTARWGRCCSCRTARPELTERRPTLGRRPTELHRPSSFEPLSARRQRAARRPAPFVANVDADERAAILERAEGNPFFLEEIVRAPAGVERRRPPYPDTVQARSRPVSTCSRPRRRRSLQAAAVVGRVFWPAAVAEVTSGSSAPVDVLLDGLQDLDLVLGRLSSSIGGQRELIFKHALIRDVAYESLPRRDRVRIPRARSPTGSSRPSPSDAARSSSSWATIARPCTGLAPRREPRAAAFAAVASAAEGALRRVGSRAGRTRSRARHSSLPQHLSSGRGRSRRSATWPFHALRRDDRVGVPPRGRRHRRGERRPYDHARLAQPVRLRGDDPGARAGPHARAPAGGGGAPPTSSSGFECVGDEDSEALFLASRWRRAYWEFGFGVQHSTTRSTRGRVAAERARGIAGGLDRLDLEAVALDALSAGLNVRGHYGLKPTRGIDEDRLAIARRDPRPVRGEATPFYTSGVVRARGGAVLERCLGSARGDGERASSRFRRSATSG